MSHGKVIQTRCEDALVSRIESYRDREELRSDSAAVRKLLTFALDILDSSADAPPISNRKLLEEILSVSSENAAMICQAHTFTYHTNITDYIRDDSKKIRAKAKEFGRIKAESFLSGEK
jgi:hypothetical protein